jgi:hypothetical protein
MRRALVAGVLLGLVVGLVVVHHQVLRLTTVWPMVLGIALWESAGARGSRGIIAALSAGGGTAAAYAVFAIVSQFLPITNTSLGIVSGLAVGVIVVIALLSRGWIPVSAPLIGFAAFFGVFEPQWRVSPSNFLSHGIDAASMVGLGLVVGALAATVVRWVTEGTGLRVPARSETATTKDEEPSTPLSEFLGGGGE